MSDGSSNIKNKIEHNKEILREIWNRIIKEIWSIIPRTLILGIASCIFCACSYVQIVIIMPIGRNMDIPKYMHMYSIF